MSTVGKSEGKSWDIMEEITKQFDAQIDEISALKVQVTRALNSIKESKKNCLKMMKQWSKKFKSNKRKENPNRQPSGFAKPTKLSDKLTIFLHLEQGSLMARTEVTKRLTKYIKANDLQWQKDKRIIKPDKKLRELLNIDKKVQLTYFNLQKYMKPLFVCEPKKTV